MKEKYKDLPEGPKVKVDSTKVEEPPKETKTESADGKKTESADEKKTESAVGKKTEDTKHEDKKDQPPTGTKSEPEKHNSSHSQPQKKTEVVRKQSAKEQKDIHALGVNPTTPEKQSKA